MRLLKILIFCLIKVEFILPPLHCWLEIEINSNFSPFSETFFLVFNHFIVLTLQHSYISIRSNCCRWYSMFTSNIDCLLLSFKISNVEHYFQSGNYSWPPSLLLCTYGHKFRTEPLWESFTRSAHPKIYISIWQASRASNL